MANISLLYLKNIVSILVTIILFPYIHKGLVAVEHRCTSRIDEKNQSMSIDDAIRTAESTNFVNVEVKEWSPLQMTNGHDFTFGNYALIVLNTPIQLDSDQMVTLWNKAEFRVTVDGGTDQWYKFCSKLLPDTGLVRKDPDIVFGNFDSIDNNTLQYCYGNSDIKVIEKRDQEKTDFTKAVEEVAEQSKGSKLDSIVVIVEHSGRLDHVMLNLDTLHKSDDILSGVVIFLLSKNSLSWLLRSGFHNIHIPMRIWQSNCWCGLVPLCGPTLVTTSGLKWNLNKQHLQFGELISTSNSYGDVSFQREGITVTTDKHLLWTMGVSDYDCDATESCNTD